MNCTIGGVQYKQGVHNKIFMFINETWIRSTITYDELKKAVKKQAEDERVAYNKRLVLEAEAREERLLVKPKSTHKGVNYNPANKRWVATIYVEKQKIYLGNFIRESRGITIRKKAERNIKKGLPVKHGL